MARSSNWNIWAWLDDLELISSVLLPLSLFKREATKVEENDVCPSPLGRIMCVMRVWGWCNPNWDLPFLAFTLRLRSLWRNKHLYHCLNMFHGWINPTEVSTLLQRSDANIINHWWPSHALSPPKPPDPWVLEFDG